MLRQKSVGVLKVLMYAGLIFFLANLNALVDQYMHPEIPYFDDEHLIVGGVAGVFGLVLGVIIFFYINRLQRINREREQILIDLSEAKLKAEESEQLKTSFLANMSHEIRTPLNGILGFASLLEGPGLTSQEQQEFLKIIQLSGDRMLNIINEIIDISRIESGVMEVKLTPVSVNGLLDTVYNLFKRPAEEKKIRLSVEKKLFDEDAVIETDKEKLYSILINLVKNAIKYTNQGSIILGYKLRTTGGSEFLQYDEGNVLEFFVKDTGIGIDVSRQRAIFDRFVQADIQDVEARQGAGLGLAISKAYVEMLGGNVWVESVLGAGSAFYFTVPYVKAELKTGFETSAAENLESGKIENLKILIAEDDRMSLDFLTKILNAKKNTLLFAQTGREAVDISRNNPDIDLIMMDIKMPEMDGYEATREIRKFNSDVVIIAQTAYALTGDKEKALSAGCNDYISKPVLGKDLYLLVQKYLKK